METKKRTQATDIAEIATKLDGKVKFSSIIYSQQMLYQYTVTDEKGNVISTRTSARDYVACTANGEFYFGRLDLIGKGDHGKGLSRTTEILANPERAYKKQVAYFVPSYRKEWIAENPADEWIARNVNWATERQKELNAIAYLQPGE